VGFLTEIKSRVYYKNVFARDFSTEFTFEGHHKEQDVGYGASVKD